MYCTECGEKLFEGNKFCGKCGNSVNKSKEINNTLSSSDLEFEINNGQVTITDYLGTERDVVIPGLIENLPVAKIGAQAFNNNNLTSVVIPDSVTELGFEAFMGNSLTSVVIPDSVKVINQAVFMKNNLTSVVIPDLEIIGGGAFMDNNLISVVIPDSVIYIDGNAFRNNNLTSVVIPDSVTDIGGGAFMDNNLTSVRIPEGCNIDEESFDENVKITRL